MITQNPTSTTSTSSPTYDPRKRDPQFAHASASPLWELTPLLKHYHPAVALHARQLLLMQPLTASPDLAQNTLMHFLDRFVYRNAKKVKGDAGEEGEGGKGGKGGSAMQPAASALEGVKLVKGDIGVNRREEVNEQIFLRKRRGEVPVDQMFFYEYFTRKNDREKARAARIKKRKEGGDSEDSEDEEEGDEGEEDEDEDEGKKGISGDEDEDEDESGSELDEDEVWKAMQATIPKVAGEDDDLLDGSDMDEDEDEIPSGLDDDSDDESEEVEGNETGKIIEDNDEEEGDLSLVEASDNEDLISLDGDLPDGLIEYDGSDASASEQEEEAWGGISGDKRNGKSNKRKRGEKGEGAKEGSRRKKLRSLPTFASYEDYAKLIEEGPEDDI